MGEAKRRKNSGIDIVRPKREDATAMDRRLGSLSTASDVFTDLERLAAKSNSDSLIRAFRKKSVRQMYDPGGELLPTVHPLDHEWFQEDQACPSFDFGGLLNPYAKNGLSESYTRTLMNDTLGADSIRLPYQKCIFFYQDRSPIPTPILSFLRQTNDGFRADTFIETKDGWVRNYVAIRYMGGREYETIVDGESDEGHAQGIASTMMMNIATCCTILASPKATTFVDGATPREAQHRHHPKHPPIPTTRIVHFDQSKYVRPEAGELHAAAGMKAPHERRGHQRTLKSGRKVWVRSCSIHGGSSEAPVYRVVP